MDSDSTGDDIIQSWCHAEIAPWRAKRVKYRAAVEEFHHYNATRVTTFLIAFKDRVVSILEKPGRENFDPEGFRMVFDRADAYRRFFQDVVTSTPAIGDGILAIEVGDGPLNSETAPVFAFQKGLGDPCILVNDVNFLECDFYQTDNFADKLAYSEKANRAVFIGSTSSSFHTRDSVRTLENPRLSAGLFFAEEPTVDFRLPNIVQCIDREAEDIIKAMGFGHDGYVSLAEQFRSKFLISMDGNGATCARVALILKSNSVLLKYKSNSQLYYFSGLIPWFNYIPINSDRDVLDVVEIELRKPGFFQYIAFNGRKFAETYLAREAGLRYASLLLTSYFETFDYS